MPSAKLRYEKKRATVHGHGMAYIETGRGDPIIFLHGNPTSSYLWRNVLPHLERHGRCIAPDLIGMGDSDKLPDSGPQRYRFVEHRIFLDGLLEQLGVASNVTFVLHDWGAALGFDWANRHRQAVRGLAHMEGVVAPTTWAAFPEPIRPLFESLRSPRGDEMVLTKNFFVERMLPGAVLRGLGEEEMAEYRRPYLNPGEDRRPTLTWPREIPIDGEPADVTAIVEASAAWLATTDVPKLFVTAEPGVLIVGRTREFCRSWPNQTEVTVKGAHFIQEDSPDEIGEAVVDWLARI